MTISVEQALERARELLKNDVAETKDLLALTTMLLAESAMKDAKMEVKQSMADAFKQLYDQVGN